MSTANQEVVVILQQLTCGTCGVVYGLSSKFRSERRNDHQTFYCPNGHTQWYPGETEAEKLKKQLDNAQKRLEWAEQGRKVADERAATAKRSAAAYKGKLTHVRKRIACGVCPCCRRIFENLHRHMTTQHPDYGKEDE